MAKKQSFQVDAQNIFILGSGCQHVSMKSSGVSPTNLREVITWLSTSGASLSDNGIESLVDRRLKELESGRCLVAGVGFNMLEIRLPFTGKSFEPVEAIGWYHGSLYFMCSSFNGVYPMIFEARLPA